MKSKKRETKTVEKIEETLPPTRMSDEPPLKMDKWVNRQRVLVFASRGISYRHRHLMEDLKKLMPHHKTEAKMERSKNLFVVNEMCEMKNCNKAMMFEGRKKKDLYVWMANVPNGPSVKFYVENLYTMAELKFTGNCLRGSRPFLSFDTSFATEPYLMLLKEILQQIFGVPKHHPKSQPFIDHVYSFTYLDNRVWFRNFQILSEDGALAEIGPRFVLNPVKIFSGSFGGTTLWENSSYVSPSRYRQSLRKKAGFKYENRVQQKVEYEASRPDTAYPELKTLDMFQKDAVEAAKAELEEEEAAIQKVLQKAKEKPRVEKQLKKVKQNMTAKQSVKKQTKVIKRKHLKGMLKPKKNKKKMQKIR